MQSAIKQESRLGDGKLLGGCSNLGPSAVNNSNSSAFSQHQGRKIWSEFRKLLRQQANKDDNGFLQLSGYVKSLCERYGTEEGVLDKVSFAEAVGDLLGHPLSTQDVDAAFEICEDDGCLNGRGSITAKDLVIRVYLEEKEQQHLLMRFREKIKKKLGKKDRYMKELYDYLAGTTRGEAAGAAELCDLFEEFLKVDLAEAEAWDILHMMNFTGDGIISLDDFMAFMGPQGLELLETNKKKLDDNAVSRLGEAIVDIKVSTLSSEEMAFEEQGYDRVEPNINGSTGKPVYLWYKRWNKDGGGARLQPIVDFLVDSKNVNSALVVDGYQCIQKNLSMRSTLSRPKYLWVRRAASEEEGCKSAIGDIAITTGKAKDRTSKIHNAPCGVFPPIIAAGNISNVAIAISRYSFVRVPENLNGSVLGEDVFLWYKPVKKSQTVNGKRVSSFLHNDENMGGGAAGFHLSSTLSDERRREELRKTIRRQLRQHVLNNSEGCVDYAGIFNRFDTKGRGKLKRAQVQKLLNEVGLNMDVRELNLFMRHIVSGASHGAVSRDDFLRFVQLTEDELDGVCKTLRKRLGISKPLRTAKLQREQIKGLRCHYESLDADGDGVLSYKEFANMFEMANIFITAEEVESIRSSRFDIDGDGRVDFLNFLQFFFSKENKEKRSAMRVSSAVDVLRSYILSLQKPKEQGKNADHVDSTTGWMELRKRHMSNHRYFNGYFVAEDIEMALQKLNVRLSQREIHQTVQRIAPLGNGHINGQDFHRFACVIPRSIGELLKIVEKDVVPIMVESYRRLRHSRMRQVHQKRNIGKRTKSTGSASHERAVCYSPSSVRTPINFGNTPNARRPCSAGTRNRNKPKTGSSFQGNLRSRSISPFHSSSQNNPKSFWRENDTEKADIWNAYTIQKEHAERAMKCNEEGFTTVEDVYNGLCRNDKDKSGKNVILHVEWVILSQFVGSDCAERYLINGPQLLEGICMAVLDEGNGPGGTNLEEMLDTNEETLNLVCEDLIEAIQDEARIPDGSLDYSKPFTLFDENGDGIIPIDEFRNMLFRLNVNVPLREKQIVELMNRFDKDRSGFISLKEFEAFAERLTWTQNSKDKFIKQRQGEGKMGASTSKLNRTEDVKTLDTHPSRLEGYLITNNRTSDAFVIGITRSLRDSYASQELAAKKLKQYLGGDDSVNITTTAMVEVLDHAGLLISNESNVNHHNIALRPLCLASGLLNTTEFIATIMKAWRILLFCELRHMGAAISGSEQLDKKLARIQNNSSSSLQLQTKALIHQHITRKYIQHEELHHLFQIFDPCKDGKIRYVELCDFIVHGNFNANPMAIRAAAAVAAAPSENTVYDSGRIPDEIDLFAMADDSSNEFDELFEDDKEDEWSSVCAAMKELCPTPSRRQKVKRYLQSQISDPTRCGNSEGTFYRFLCRAIGPECSLDSLNELLLSQKQHRLSYDDLNKIMRHLRSKSRGGGINYDVFIQKALQYDEQHESSCAWGGGKIHVPSAIINHIQDSVARAALEGRTFHTFFSLSDTMKTGLISRESFRVTLSMLGCRLSDKDELALLKALPTCSNGMVDYEALYRLLLNHTPPPHLTRALHLTPYNGGGVLSWPPPPIPSSTGPPSPYQILSDPTFEDIAARVRQCVLESTKQWGPVFSLSRQFEFHDPQNQGVTTPDDFFIVLEQLGIQLSGIEIQHLRTLFDSLLCGYYLLKHSDPEELNTLRCSLVIMGQRLSRRNFVLDFWSSDEVGWIHGQCLECLTLAKQVQCIQDKFRQLGDVDAVSYEEFLAFVASSNPPLCQTTNATQRSPGPKITPWGRGASTSSESGKKIRRETLDNYMPETSAARYRKSQNSDGNATTLHAAPFEPRRVDSLGGLEREIPSPNSASVYRNGHLRQVKKNHLSDVNAAEWACTVCFYSSNAPKSPRCEICAARKSGKSSAQVQQRCTNCTYANDELEVECRVCGEPLMPHGRSKEQSGSRDINNKHII